MDAEPTNDDPVDDERADDAPVDGERADDAPVDGEPIPVTAAVDGGTAKLLPDVDRPRAWLLTVDGAPQSYVDLDDPTYLEFEYARRVAHVIDASFDTGRPLDVLHLGAGALTLPRFLAATRPRSRQLVIDNDRPLLRLVTDHLPLPAGSGITLLAEDARTALEQVPPGAYDLIIADVYGGSRSPARIASAEYARAAATALRSNGIYIANLADSAPFRFLGSQLANAAPVFTGRCLIAEPGVLRGRRFGNALLVAAHREPEVADFARRVAADPFPARVVHGDSLTRLCPDAQPVPDTAAVPSPEPPRGAFTVG